MPEDKGVTHILNTGLILRSNQVSTRMWSFVKAGVKTGPTWICITRGERCGSSISGHILAAYPTVHLSKIVNPVSGGQPVRGLLTLRSSVEGGASYGCRGSCQGRVHGEAEKLSGWPGTAIRPSQAEERLEQNSPRPSSRPDNPG